MLPCARETRTVWATDKTKNGGYKEEREDVQNILVDAVPSPPGRRRAEGISGTTISEWPENAANGLTAPP